MYNMEYKGIKCKKDFSSMTDNVVSVLADGKFPVEDIERFKQIIFDASSDRVIAVIEFPYLDIELEWWADDGDDFRYAQEKNSGISLSYFVCTNDGESWASDDYVNGDVNVDFSSPTWEKDLENDMCESLVDYAKSHGRSLTEPNEHSW